MSRIAAVRTVMAAVAGVRGWQEDFYRDLHRHPELSHQEHRTAAAVAGRLCEAGFEVTAGVGGTGVVGVLRNGYGPTVLLRADMDALPVVEDTGLPYASTAPGVAHACGHDMHTACLAGAAWLLAEGRKHWRGTLVAVFQPAEETIDGAQAMVDGGLATVTGKVDVVLAQHVTPLPAGTLAAIPGTTLAGGASVRVRVYGRGGHASAPQNAVDPVVIAAAIIMRLQTVVAREVDPGEAAVLTVGCVRAGTKANIIADHAELLVNIRFFNIRFYRDGVREAMLGAIRRIVTAECSASGSPRPPDIDVFESAPLTDNDPAVTATVTDAFTAVFGTDAVITVPPMAASEDFSVIADGVGAPYCYWLIGGVDPAVYRAAEAEGRLATDIPVNHSPHFAPVLQPTLDTGTAALVTAALAWLGG